MEENGNVLYPAWKKMGKYCTQHGRKWESIVPSIEENRKALYPEWKNMEKHCTQHGIQKTTASIGDEKIIAC